MVQSGGLDTAAITFSSWSPPGRSLKLNATILKDRGETMSMTPRATIIPVFRSISSAWMGVMFRNPLIDVPVCTICWVNGAIIALLETVTSADLFVVSASSCPVDSFSDETDALCNLLIGRGDQFYGTSICSTGNIVVCNGPCVTFSGAGEQIICQRSRTLHEGIANQCGQRVIFCPRLVPVFYWLLECVEFLNTRCNCYTVAL